LTKEDEILYNTQLEGQSGSTTDQPVEYIPHPSKVRKLSQGSDFDVKKIFF